MVEVLAAVICLLHVPVKQGCVQKPMGVSQARGDMTPPLPPQLSRRATTDTYTSSTYTSCKHPRQPQLPGALAGEAQAPLTGGH